VSERTNKSLARAEYILFYFICLVAVEILDQKKKAVPQNPNRQNL
jgi:hypothetical protein